MAAIRQPIKTVADKGEKTFAARRRRTLVNHRLIDQAGVKKDPRHRWSPFNQEARNAAPGKLLESFADQWQAFGVDTDGNDFCATFLQCGFIDVRLVAGADEPDRHHLVLEEACLRRSP